MGRGIGGSSGAGSSGAGRSSGGHSSSNNRSSGGRMHSAERMNPSSSGRGTVPSGPASPRPSYSAPRQQTPRSNPVAPRPIYSPPRQTYNAPRRSPVPPRQTYNAPRANPPSGPTGSNPGGMNGGFGGGMGCGTGCSFAIIALIIVLVIGIVAFPSMLTGGSSYQQSAPRTASASSGSITKSTTKREKLDKKYSKSTVLYVDELGWIDDSSYLNKCLTKFYDETGVHPLLYITDTVNGTTAPTEADMSAYADSLYSSLCPDEGHMLLLFHCLDNSTDYCMWYTCGAQAKTVIDSEAANILMDYIDSYFFDEDKTDTQVFGDAYTAAAKRIMTKTTSPIVYVVIFAGIIGILLILFMWWKKRREQKEIEYQRTQELLNTELHTFDEQESDKAQSDLEAKYSDAPDPSDTQESENISIEELEKKYSDT